MNQSRGNKNYLADQKAYIVVASTFTAEPVEEGLTFWMQELGLPSEIKFAPYNQVFQELLDPASIFSRNTDGFNLILLRWEDWLREKHSVDPQMFFERNLIDLQNALLSAHLQAPCILLICPASPAELAVPGRAQLYQSLERRLSEVLKSNSLVHLIPSDELQTYYPVQDYYDSHTDELGHVPFTPTMFAAIASLLARKINAWLGTPYKVIVLDCDNTLWHGICAEDGPSNVQITNSYQALQNFMCQQQQAGKLLCLCSKNEEDDVWQVFSQHPNMILKREDLVATHINWLPKSENIQSLSEELNLSLDSFIFIDDNPLECAEVRANCPDVFVLELPSEPEQIIQMLQHQWVFDQIRVTAEDQRRTQMYKENSARQRFQTEAITFESFLAQLELCITIQEPTPDQLERVSELTQRTNQFNTTTLRRYEAEIQPNACQVVDLSDRFGDYGLVGAMFYKTRQDTLEVDNLLLSCRALGRGVENHMLEWLREEAKKQGLKWVDIAFIPSPKNRPVLEFLEKVGKVYRQPQGTASVFRYPLEVLENLKDIVLSTDAPKPETRPSAFSTPTQVDWNSGRNKRLSHIGSRLLNMDQILQAVQSSSKPTPYKDSGLYKAPRTATEELLAGIWAQVLRMERVGIHDNFFELGGDSLSAVRVIGRTGQIGLPLTLKQLSEHKTIMKLAAIIDTAQSASHVLPLTLSQARLLNANLPTYHVIAGLFEVTWMEPVWIKTIIRHLNTYHDQLRARFVKNGSTWQQILADPDEKSSFIHIDLSTLQKDAHKPIIESITQGLQSGFNLAQGNLWRVAFFDFGKDQSSHLFIVAHEIVSDAALLSILYENFQTAYRQLSANQDIQLPAKNIIRQLNESSEIYAAIVVENRWISTIGAYCKVYPLKVLHTFPGWNDREQMAGDGIIYLHDNYVVTKDIFKDQQVIFEDVTPGWVAFCHDQLGFKSPAFAQNALVIEKGVVGERLPRITRGWFDPDQPKYWWRIFEAAYEVPHELNVFQLKQAVRYVVTQYDGLRLRIVKDETGYHFFIALVDPNVFIEQDISSIPEGEQEQALHKIIETQWASLNLATGPLLRIVYLNRGPTRPAGLLIIIHHALMDAYALELFLNDFENACGQLLRGESLNTLPSKTTFKVWAERMDTYCRSEAGKQDLDWWLSLPWARVHLTPLDYPENQVISRITPTGAVQGDYYYTKETTLWGKLTIAETKALLKAIQVYKVGILDVLYTALALTFYQWQKVSPIYVFVGDNNRSLFDDLNLTRTIGYLTSHCPVLLEVSSDDVEDHWGALNSIKEQLARIPHHGNLWDWYLKCYPDLINNYLPTLFNVFFLYNGDTSNFGGRGSSSIFRRIPLLARTQQLEPLQTETQQQSKQPFDCVADIFDGEFRIQWRYKEGLHTHSTVEILVQTYLDVLRSFSQDEF